MVKLSFTQFYQANYRMAFFYTYRRILNTHTTEDILADSFLATYESWAKIIDQNYKNYFFRILQNQINSYLRKIYQFELLQLDSEHEEFESYQYIDRISDYKSIIREKLALLPKSDQQYFELKYSANFSFRQIAEQLNISLNNAKVINNRLIKKLKQLCIK